VVTAEEWSIQRKLAALREGQVAIPESVAALQRGQAALEQGQLQLAAELDRTRRLREDIRDLRVQVTTLQNGLFVFAGATVAGLLGVIATLIATG
jgi:hypothetical protein